MGAVEEGGRWEPRKSYARSNLQRGAHVLVPREIELTTIMAEESSPKKVASAVLFLSEGKPSRPFIKAWLSVRGLGLEEKILPENWSLSGGNFGHNIPVVPVHCVHPVSVAGRRLSGQLAVCKRERGKEAIYYHIHPSLHTPVWPSKDTLLASGVSL